MTESEQKLRHAMSVYRNQGVSLESVQALVEEIWAVRRVNGFEIYPDWKMPEPPEEGMYACFVFHGGDGMELFWWHPSWGRWPSTTAAWNKAWEAKRAGKEWANLDDHNPLIEPDTGGSRRPECETAYRQLGFEG